MTSSLPPRLRDTKRLADRVHQDRINLGQLGVGFMGGRFPPLRPLGSAALLGDIEDDQASDVDTSQILFWNSDSTVATADDQPVTLTLTYEPLDDDSIIVAKNGMNLLRSEWSRTGNQVTVEPSAGVTIRTGDIVHSPLYAYYPSDAPSVEPLTELILRGAIDAGMGDPLTGLDLPASTEIGDLIVVASATMRSDTTPGSAGPDDDRLTQVSHNTWLGRATTLDPVVFVNPNGDEFTCSLAVFAAPLSQGDVASVGPIAGTETTMTAPLASNAGAVLVVTSENPNGAGYTFNSVPAGYAEAAHSSTALTTCAAGIYYWIEAGATESPAGVIDFSAHFQGFAYATVVGLGTI